jgi:HSP20 family protein
MESEMAKWFGEEPWEGNGGFMPSVNVAELENEFEVKVDLPGLKPEEVQVEVKGNELWISGKREEEKEEKGKTFHRVERNYGEFRRILPLPSAVTAEQIEAKLESGVLIVHIPKTEEATPKKIQVK